MPFTFLNYPRADWSIEDKILDDHMGSLWRVPDDYCISFAFSKYSLQRFKSRSAAYQYVLYVKRFFDALDAIHKGCINVHVCDFDDRNEMYWYESDTSQERLEFRQCMHRRLGARIPSRSWLINLRDNFLNASLVAGTSEPAPWRRIV